LLFNRLIKKYRFIAAQDREEIKHAKIIKSGNFRFSDSVLAERASIDLEKKNSRVGTVGKRTPAGSQTAKNAAGLKPSLDKSNIAPPNRLNQLSDRSGQPESHEIDIAAIKARFNQEYDEKLKTQKDKIYNDGFNEGHKAGLAEGKAEAAKATQLVEDYLAEINNKNRLFFEETEKLITDLAVHLAGKIIGEAISAVPDVIKSNVEKCVELLAGSGDVIVKINPSDYELIKEHLPKLDQKYEGKYNFKVEPENSISRGGCLVEMGGSIIDGRIEVQYEKIKQHMEMLT
jgi:flagellar biosynthesis/type III secretory pathway protein FliH